MSMRLHTNADLGEAELRVAEAHGWERVSELYEYTFQVEISQAGGLDDDALDELINSPVKLDVADGSMTVHGVVKRVVAHSMAEEAPPLCELVVGPRCSRLELTRRSRVVAQDKSHLDVIKQVLDEHGIAYEDQCQAGYATREYVVQYQETDLAFLLRLMQYNGVHFHFRQDDEHEVLILGDANSAFQSVVDAEQLRYHPALGRASASDPVVSTLERTRAPRAAAVVLRDYDWRAPRAPLHARASADERTGAGIWDLFGEHWHDEAEGRRLAEVRAQQHLQRSDVFSGTTYLRALRAGHWFELTDHPNPDYNRRYVVTETAEMVHGDESGYSKHFAAVPFDLTVRPERTIPWPRIDGLLTALVDGESRSTATPIDDRGRYRVVFPLDGAGRAGGRATRWVRRAQPYSGEGYGMHMPLHIGTEVAVAHVNGDPDRPVILGAVPNAATQSPVTSTNATAGMIRTGSGIVIELEDDA